MSPDPARSAVPSYPVSRSLSGNSMHLFINQWNILGRSWTVELIVTDNTHGLLQFVLPDCDV